LRPIVGGDLPVASASAKGGVIVNGNGLAMSDDTITIGNTVTPETVAYHVVRYGPQGLITGGRALTGADLPACYGIDSWRGYPRHRASCFRGWHA
jgi:hypothetical protein